jgi:hypothetical protein
VGTPNAAVYLRYCLAVHSYIGSACVGSIEREPSATDRYKSDRFFPYELERADCPPDAVVDSGPAVAGQRWCPKSR